MPVTTSNHTGTTSRSGGASSMSRGGGVSRSGGFGTKSNAKSAKGTKASYGYSARSSFEAAKPKANGVNGRAHISSVTNKGARNQMASGTITVNGRTYSFKSGGAGKGNLPKGKYDVTAHRNSRTDKKSMMRDGVGYSFALSNKYDARVGATRTELRIHPDGGRPGTIGCIGIQGNGATQRAFRDDMNAELKRNGGRYSLSVD
jgi:hypothetical protein